MAEVPGIVQDAIKEALPAAVPRANPTGLGAVACGGVAAGSGLTGTVVLESWWYRPRDLDSSWAGTGTGYRGTTPSGGPPTASRPVRIAYTDLGRGGSIRWH